MDIGSQDLATLLPRISAQIRMVMSDLNLAEEQLFPPEEREKDPELDRKAAQLDRNFYRMMHLVTELSDAVWLSQKQRFKLRNDDLVALVEEVFACAESTVEPLGMEMTLRCALPKRICAFDRAAVEQCLYQLISNAVKYNPRGTHIVVELKKSGDQLLLSVEDNGVGISENEQEDLFVRCFGEAVPIPPQGLGLGLCLCRQVAEGHEGSLRMEPVEGGGSRFILALPDRKTRDLPIRDLGFDYAGGFNRSLLHFADVLPVESFQIKKH